MKKNIWIVSNNKRELLDAQRAIDADGGMKSICLMSKDAISKAFERLEEMDNNFARPSVLLIDYDMGKEEDFECLRLIMSNTALVGIPLFFMTRERTDEIDEHCYELGASIIIKKPLSDTTVRRVERVAWQQEMTKNYENLLYRQAEKLRTAKEIKRLNEMLEARNKVLRQVFGKYFSENVVDVILENENGASLGGEKKEVSVIMADLRGFTSLSDTLSAEAVVEMLDIFLEEMTKIISKYKGTIIEFIGDAVLAVFGAPHVMENSECEALKAAIEMQNSMAYINRINVENGNPTIEMGIGIHKGDVFVGNIGSEYMMRYNAIGQAVNVCSRIQSYSLGGQILCSEKSLVNIENDVTKGSMFDITVKGVRGNIAVSEILAIKDGEYKYELNQSEDKEVQMDEIDIPCLIYEIQDKRVNTYAIHGKIIAISEKMMVFASSSKELRELAEHIDVEIVVQGKNAYGKVINVTNDQIEIYFTYKSDRFMEMKQ